eukprot:355237-Chlamydomonas_euryale.AAC.3
MQYIYAGGAIRGLWGVRICINLSEALWKKAVEGAARGGVYPSSPSHAYCARDSAQIADDVPV